MAAVAALAAPRVDDSRASWTCIRLRTAATAASYWPTIRAKAGTCSCTRALSRTRSSFPRREAIHSGRQASWKAGCRATSRAWGRA